MTSVRKSGPFYEQDLYASSSVAKHSSVENRKNTSLIFCCSLQRLFDIQWSSANEMSVVQGEGISHFRENTKAAAGRTQGSFFYRQDRFFLRQNTIKHIKEKIVSLRILQKITFKRQHSWSLASFYTCHCL